jgi:hypothetical protein
VAKKPKSCYYSKKRLALLHFKIFDNKSMARVVLRFSALTPGPSPSGLGFTRNFYQAC